MGHNTLHRFAKFIGELPQGYDYKIFQYDTEIKIVGAAQDKEPICFTLDCEMRLSRLKIDLDKVCWS